MDRKQYEKDLKRRQRKHLENIMQARDANWKPCAHDQCTSCHGTGVKHDGSACIHNLYCDCPRCAITCSTGDMMDTGSYTPHYEDSKTSTTICIPSFVTGQ